MVDAVLTVKGYFTLAAMYQLEFDAWNYQKGDWSPEEYDAAMKLRAKAQHCRECAYDLLGVATLPANQLPLATMKGEIIL